MIPNDQLNDLLIDAGRSLLQYVGESWPWSGEDEADERAALERIIAEQRGTVLQFATLLDDRGHRITYGQYPSEYTSLHYVALDYLLDQLVAQQQSLASELAGAVADADGGDEAAHAVLSAAAEQARRHADELSALAARRKSRSTVVG